MAVLSAGGCWLPIGLTFGPTNGPEDFQELVFTVFSRRLYKEWFLFVDDLSVATGRKKCHGDVPSGAHDISCVIRGDSDGENGQRGLNTTSAGFTSPFAHPACLSKEMSKAKNDAELRKAANQMQHEREIQYDATVRQGRRDQELFQEWDKVGKIIQILAGVSNPSSKCIPKFAAEVYVRSRDGTTKTSYFEMIRIMEGEKRLPCWQARLMMGLKRLAPGEGAVLSHDQINVAFVEAMHLCEELFVRDGCPFGEYLEELEILWCEAESCFEPVYIWPGSDMIKVVAGSQDCRLGIVMDVAIAQCKIRKDYKVNLVDLLQEVMDREEIKEEILGPCVLRPSEKVRVPSPYAEAWLEQTKYFMPDIVGFSRAVRRHLSTSEEAQQGLSTGGL